MAKATALPYGPSPEPEAYSVSLHYEGGGSDKVYELSVERSGDGWVVNYANGRRGGTLAHGTKTKGPTDYASAAKICSAQLSEKVSKGYVPKEGSRLGEGMAARAIETVERAASGHVPQLSNPIDDDELEHYLGNDAYAAQQKHNGERRIVIVRGGVASGGNRKGQSVALPAGISGAAAGLGVDVVLDGEQVGDVFHAFDVLERDGRDLRRLPMRERVGMLAEFGREPAIRITPTAFGEADKRRALGRAVDLNHEGLIFKRVAAPYASGRPNSGGDSVKFKLYKTLSAVVSSVNDRRSVALSLREEDGSTVQVGNVTVPANREVPREGQVVEVRYLYAYEGGSLYQPTYEGVRTDVEPSECAAGQRVFKAEAEDAPGFSA